MLLVGKIEVRVDALVQQEQPQPAHLVLVVRVAAGVGNKHPNGCGFNGLAVHGHGASYKGGVALVASGAVAVMFAVLLLDRDGVQLAGKDQ